MQILWWSPLRWESKNQISLLGSTIEHLEKVKSKHRVFRKGNQKVPQKRFPAYYCLDGLSGIDDWNFVIFEQCETHE